MNSVVSGKTVVRGTERNEGGKRRGLRRLEGISDNVRAADRLGVGMEVEREGRDGGWTAARGREGTVFLIVIVEIDGFRCLPPKPTDLLALEVPL